MRLPGNRNRAKNGATVNASLGRFSEIEQLLMRYNEGGQPGALQLSRIVTPGNSAKMRKIDPKGERQYLAIAIERDRINGNVCLRSIYLDTVGQFHTCTAYTAKDGKQIQTWDFCVRHNEKYDKYAITKLKNILTP